MEMNQKLHNPHYLTASQVGQDFRLLFHHELRERKPTFAIQCWDVLGKCWVTAYPFQGNDPGLTYRVALDQVKTLNRQ